MKLVAALVGGAFAITALSIAAAGLAVGLDLGFLRGKPQPRTELIAKLDTDALPRFVVRKMYPTVRDGLREPRIGFASITASGDAIDVTIGDGVDRQQAVARLQALSQSAGSNGEQLFTISEAGGTALRLTPTAAAISVGATDVIDQTISVIGRRLESLQVKATLHREGSDSVAIDVPETEATHLRSVIVTPGQLAFRFVDSSMEVEDARRKGELLSHDEILQDRSGTYYLVEKRVAMSGDNLVDAQPGFDQRTNEPIVSFRFNAAGTRQFARITEEGVGRPMTVVLDTTVLAAPIIREPIVGGSGQISGNFTVQSANDLAIMLRSGALPVPLTIVDEHPLAPPAHR